MSQDWISSKYGVLVYGLTRSDHPAWVWLAEGDSSLWHNQAARWFEARHKNGTAKPAGPARPIKGQVRRLLRLGFTGVPSLARVQMLVDRHPVSQTCRCTPIILADGERALLCISADPVALDTLLQSDAATPVVDRLLPHLGAYALIDGTGMVWSGSPSGITAGQSGKSVDAQHETTDDDLSLHIFSGTRDDEAEAPPPASVAEQTAPTPIEPEQDAPGAEISSVGRLAELMERFETDSSLFDPLGPQDEVLPDALSLSKQDRDAVAALFDEPHGPGDDQADPQDVEDLELLDGTGADGEQDLAPDDHGAVEDEPAAPKVQWRVTGRDFVPDSDESASEDLQETPETLSARDAPGDADEQPGEELDQAARYNFDELARILGDRVASEDTGQKTAEPALPAERRSAGRTLSLSDEHLVLNRLPLGILVFRDQSIVFANRAMADLLACASIAELRDRGLDAIFPRMGEPGVNPGPVATLLDSNGTQVPVSARLQAISWQGGPALMLSARREDSSPSAEVMVRNFVETLAASRGDGFVEISRAGVIEAASGRAADLMGRNEEIVIGRPLASFIAEAHIPNLRGFLEKPARRAGIDRPHLRIRTATGAELSLFTEGSAGIVTGYFGFIADLTTAKVPTANDASQPGKDPALMAKMSRGLRRPLNTIIGFSQLLENQAFGPLGHARYLEYSRDIRSAGREIEGLVDELDQYSGLQSKEFLAEASDFSLEQLLSECETVVRHQAGRRQVFVRSAISESLPYIRADRTLLRQALLNLLASAIDQTPQGGKVILTAQVEDDGSASVHVRDSGSGEAELSERFAVFREKSAAHGEAMVPMKSSIGLALTRSLLAVNACALTIDPSSGTGTLMSLQIPADLTRSPHIQADELPEGR